MDFDEAHEMAGRETFIVTRDGQELFEVRGVRTSLDKPFMLPPDATEIRPGDWLKNMRTGQEFRITDIDVPPQFEGIAIIKAPYESRQAYEDRLAAERRTGGTSISFGGDIHGSNLNWGDQRSVEMSGHFDFRSIEAEIDQRGGADAEKLRAALAEVRDLVEKGEPLREGVLSRFAKVVREHSWFSSHVGRVIVEWLSRSPPPS